MFTPGKTIFSALLFFLFLSFLPAQDTSAVFKPTIKVEGRIHYDFELLKFDEESALKNGFRRVRFAMSGNVGKSLGYMVDVDFARARLGFRHVYIKYRSSHWGDFVIGSFPEPTSLNMLTSSHYITFFERAMLTNLQNFRFGAGFHYQNFDLLKGRMGVQMAYTFNGLNTEGFYDEDVTDGGNFVARITTKAFENKTGRSLVHIGANYAMRTNDEAWGYQFRSRPENHTGEKIIASFDEGGEVDSRSSIGLEAAGVLGPLSVQGEYKRMLVMTDEMTFRLAAYYAFVSFFVTGEQRTYKNGAFSRVLPKKPIDKGGPGAFELALRYSVMDTSDSPTTFMEMPTFGLTKDWSFGLNWYLNSYARVVYNYVVTDFGFTAPNPDHKERAHLLRFQVQF